MNRICKAMILGIFAIAVWGKDAFSAEAAAGGCDRPVAIAVSVQGDVSAKRGGKGAGEQIRRKDAFCTGDVIRVMERSRADLVLRNETMLRLDQNTEIRFVGGEEEEDFLVDVLLGGAYFITRTPKGFKVNTPFVNAGVEGTEFSIRVGKDRAFLTVFEGKVKAANDAGSLSLAGGQSAEVEAGKAPALRIVARPRDAVQWTLFYPPAIEPRPGAPPDWRSRAASLLSVGRVEEARAEIEEALKSAPRNADALALQAVIAVAQNERVRALELAKKSVDVDPKSAAARIALSYARQANFDLEGALSSLREAVKSEPENALARARLSELLLSFGRLDEALEEAKKAAAQNPDIARTQTVLGFAYLAQVRTKDSRAAFEKAIDLDQADPLPRLGLGLTTIREGDVAVGRAEIEIAASLDPNSSLIRSYLGKAYYEEKRDRHASSQFAMAKELDPFDPTPFFYDAILKQTSNRPVEALHDLQKSITLNNNRAVYRSRLLLDEDLAARSASLGRIYSDLGFQQLALVEGWKSVNTDPANYSAHRFLADSYAALPRHEIARLSELLQSQLLQPININPIQPSLAQSNLFILEGTGPSSPSFNEFNPLFTRNRFALQANGVLGEHSTRGGEVVQSGVAGNLSYSVGVFNFHTDGFRPNNFLDQHIVDVFAQQSVSHNTSLQMEFRGMDTRKGDLTLNFDPAFSPDFQETDEIRAARIGFHHGFSPGSDLIGYLAYQTLDGNTGEDLTSSLGFSYNDNLEDKSTGGELQHLFRASRFQLVTGGGYFALDRDERIVTVIPLPPPDPAMEDILALPRDHIRHGIVYAYSHIHFPRNVTLTVGASGDFYRNDFLGDRNQFNPKFGVLWNPRPSTTIRAAVLRTLKRHLVNEQTLEPTQVAGFNQFFDDSEGTSSWRYGVAIDQKFSENVFGGVEYSQRDLDVAYYTLNVPAPPAFPFAVPGRVDWKERLGRGYLFWTPHPWFSLSAEYQYEQFDRGPENNAGIEQVKTHKVPLRLGFFHPSGLFAYVKETYIDQDGKFLALATLTPEPGSDRFWITDASIGYRLPKRYGIFAIEARNLFDQSFRYQDTDPVSPVLQPVRSVVFKLTLAL
jgi:tetratricopeptide (TPR) repeat protein